MLSEFTYDLSNLYSEGVEADYFRSKEEMIEKIKLYCINDQVRKSVAFNGYERVIQSGHDIDSRMKMLLDWINDIRNKATGVKCES